MPTYCFTIPYLPGGVELHKKFAKEDCGHTKDHDEFYKLAGVTREQVWLQRSPPGSGAPDVEVVLLDTEDLAKTGKEFATSNHPWAIKCREVHKKMLDIDPESGSPPPLNEMIVNWSEK